MWADISSLSDFLPTVVEVEPSGDGGFDIMLQLGETTEQAHIALTAIEKPRRLVWRSNKGARWNGELIFRPTVEGTEIRFIVDYEPASVRANPTAPRTFVPTWNVGGDLLSFKNYAEKTEQGKVAERHAEPVGA
jgi:uncharacterized membrane protein